MKIPLSAIVTDARLQPRESMNPTLVREYADEMANGAEFPPAGIVSDGTTFWLYDGFHRVAAAHELGHQEIEADVAEGDFWLAVERSAAANATHGLRRTNADKRRAI